jgi:5-methylcytosine-specific restriction endonuclease McrA
MSRSVPEWIGKTDDSKVPPRVRLRIFERFGGRCYLSGRLLRPGDKWELEHVVALSNGGQHRESNLAPALQEAHREKTKADRKIQKKIDRTRKNHNGIKVRKGPPMPGSRASRWKRKIGGGIIER